MIAPPPPSPALADAVRAGRWQEVRALTVDESAPLAPPVALAAAMALRETGSPGRAAAVARAAIPAAVELGAALRLEAAAATLVQGLDPWPDLAPLLRRDAPPAARRAAVTLLVELGERAPLPLVRKTVGRPLPRGLRRELEASLAVRQEDVAAALRVVRADPGSAAAARVALFLAGRASLPAADRVAAARALLAGGWWREAGAMLASLAPGGTPDAAYDVAFLRGRAAYRLEQFGDAAGWFERALGAATSPDDRFEAAVQRARIAELAREWAGALQMWNVARTAAPAQIEGWDGATRALVVLGRPGGAVALFRRAPARIRAAFGARLAAALLAHGATRDAQTVLSLLPQRQPVVRVLNVAMAVGRGQADEARARAAAILADPRAGPWRELVLDLLPPPTGPPPVTIAPTRSPEALATLAVTYGPDTARRALAEALAADPDWSPLLGASPAAGPPLDRVIGELGAVGLESVAATLFSGRFPSSTPTELAWSASHLAMWGNLPAALRYGERLWDGLGGVPAVLVPDRLLARVLPAELVEECARAARSRGISAAWLVGIVRQESRFAVAARSAAGALGLAQLVPETLRRLGVDPLQAYQPEHALGLAATEVAQLQARFAGRLVPVAAAYNAGPAMTGAWLDALGNGAADVLVTAAIPYSETADYVLGVAEGAALGRVLDGPGAAAP